MFHDTHSILPLARTMAKIITTEIIKQSFADNMSKYIHSPGITGLEYIKKNIYLLETGVPDIKPLSHFIGQEKATTYKKHIQTIGKILTAIETNNENLFRAKTTNPQKYKILIESLLKKNASLAAYIPMPEHILFETFFIYANQCDVVRRPIIERKTQHGEERL